MNLATKKLKDLIGADYNPRKDLQPGDPEYELLKKSIKLARLTNRPRGG